MKRTIQVSLVGNPNSGKSSLFNALTGLNQKVANFPGVTVEKKTGTCELGRDAAGRPVMATITDLPGTYSLYPKSIDEQIPLQVLCDPDNAHHPDVTIVIADASNIKRSLFLCSQIMDLKSPVVLVLNMMDLLHAKGLKVDLEGLSAKLGVQVQPMNARTGEGVQALKRMLLSEVTVPVNEFLDVKELAGGFTDAVRSVITTNSAYAAIQAVCNYPLISYFNSRPDKRTRLEALMEEHHFDPKKFQARETLKRYEVISALMKDCVKQESPPPTRNMTRGIDQVLTHRLWGYGFFLVILFLIFQFIFSVARYPMDWFDQGIAFFSHWLESVMPAGVLRDLLINGILAGLAGIVIFVPQIALLFFFIAVLEDTGYMARVSFIMDKLLRKFGLNGRSIIPLMSGVACAVPAILSTRTIQNRKERLLTILVTPLMSCSARLPVYTLLISLVIPTQFLWGFINLQGLVMMGLYLIGFLAALAASFLLKFIVKSGKRAYFIMEMPEYRMPRWSNIGITILEKVKIFLFDAGKIIIAISVILWVLSAYGPGEEFKKWKAEETAWTQSKKEIPEEIDNQIQSKKLEASYAGVLGKWMEPAIKPLGFDWKIGIALVTSFAAREVFVGTMSTIYSVGKSNDNLLTVRDKMVAEINPDTGLPRYSLAVGLSLMLFYAFAMQCMSTLAVVKRETGSWNIPLFQFAYMGALAYIASLVIYQFLK